ncbi:MAG: GLUG motif-containing protein [Sedimentisphaerales bacterium]|jgi:hypothetical protein|nr:GLUG motif-containing protein [Sedimentisphaerales bacterium]
MFTLTSSFAAQFAGGSGTPDDRYQIATAGQLIAIGQDPNLWSKCFVLVADIDLDPSLFGGRVFDDALIAPDQEPSPNGSRGVSFHGLLDGHGHKIRNLCMDVAPGLDAGLFGMLGPGSIVMDLHIEDAKVQGTPAGIVAGHCSGGLILNCSISGQVEGPNDVGGIIGATNSALLMQCDANVTVVGQDQVGGLCGTLLKGQIIDSSVKGTVTGRKAVGGVARAIVFEAILSRTQVDATIIGIEQVGGLVGLCSGTIVESSAKGIVTGQEQVGGLIGLLSSGGSMHGTGVVRSASHCQLIGQQEVGGLIGSAGLAGWPDSGPIIDCYARGSVIGNDAGGLIGRTAGILLVNCYTACRMAPASSEDGLSSLGGLFGIIDTKYFNYHPLVIACFWDQELSGLVRSTGGSGPELGEGLSTKQMKRYQTFNSAGWDMIGTWR